MEIVFNKVSYNNSLFKNNIQDINLTCNDGKITGIVGEELTIIAYLLMGIKRPSKGELRLGDISIKRSSHIINGNELKKKLGFVSFELIDNINTVKDEIKERMKNYGYKTRNITKHIVDSLIIVGLDDSYLSRKINTLSNTEKRRVQLAAVISYNPEVIILENFHRGFTYKEKEYFRKLFLKLKNKFNKTIILLENDLTYLFDIVDNVYVIHKGKVVLHDNKNIFYNDVLYKYMEMPKIIEFTKYVQDQGHDILEYTDLKELIKELYRNVG